MKVKKEQMNIQNQRFLKIKDVEKLFPFLTQESIRWLIYSNPEFRKKCTFRLGKNILIGVPELLKFIEDKKGK